MGNNLIKYNSLNFTYALIKFFAFHFANITYMSCVVDKFYFQFSVFIFHCSFTFFSLLSIFIVHHSFVRSFKRSEQTILICAFVIITVVYIHIKWTKFSHAIVLFFIRKPSFIPPSFRSFLLSFISQFSLCNRIASLSFSTF